VHKIIVPNLEMHSPGGLLAKMRRVNIRDSSLRQIIDSLQSDEILYTRMLYPSKLTSDILKSPRKCKIVIECQSVEPDERRLAGDYLFLLYDFVYGGDIRKYCDGIVGVTEQITRYEVSRCGDPDKPHITIGNGFNIDSVSVRKQVPNQGQHLHLLCVAYVSPWHGLDRLIRGIAAYKGPAKITLHIAGQGSEIPELKKLVNESDINEKVIFHGFLQGKDLDDLFNTCQIAVGSLGLHRIGLTEASILKAREYCARGIPYIIACSDPDFSNDFPYILRIPADETKVDVNNVIEFARRIREDPEHPQRMRAYAVEYLDWGVKMKKLKAFLETQFERPGRK
jgi:glycosyltransferase involved in cell wall biosynthesis